LQWFIILPDGLLGTFIKRRVSEIPESRTVQHPVSLVPFQNHSGAVIKGPSPVPEYFGTLDLYDGGRNADAGGLGLDADAQLRSYDNETKKLPNRNNNVLADLVCDSQLIHVDSVN
jgi:hypothetical protein